MNERRTRHKIGLCTIFSPCAVPLLDDDEDWPSYYYQACRTLNMRSLYDHPEIEALITFSTENGGQTIVKYLARCVKEGARYRAGDRVSIPDRYGRPHCTVEFKEFTDEHHCPALRAVVLGLEKEYQAIPFHEAFEFIEAHPDTIDPYEGY